MEYKVVISERAKADMEIISSYISDVLFAPESAHNLMDEILQKAHGLTRMPKRFPLVSNKRLARIGVRLITVKNYLVFYIVNDQTLTVTVTRVSYARRDWMKIL